jgi:thioredoxin-like negative regulator of GroEL
LLSKFAFLSLLCALLAVSRAGATQAGAAQSQRYFEEGEKALAEGRYGDAERAYEKLRELAPNMAEAHARLGLIYYQQGKFEQAERAAGPEAPKEVRRLMEDKMTDLSLFRGIGHDHKNQNCILTFDPKTDDIDRDSGCLHSSLERVWADR